MIKINNNEAVTLMRLLKLRDETYLFPYNLFKSTKQGFLTYLTPFEILKVNEFERTYNARVYHVIELNAERGRALLGLCFCDNRQNCFEKLKKQALKVGEGGENMLLYVIDEQNDKASGMAIVSLKPHKHGGLIGYV